MASILTGSAYWKDEIGNLWLAESYEDERGKVTTQQTELGNVETPYEDA